ncbi:MAG: hypothetical protein K6A34_06095 [Methanobrevibacter sp.]|nr:hypothetical protein [Methanobrevibacter sp.]
MATYVVAADNIDGKEQTYIKSCISALEKKGHTCENAGVGPNTIQSVGLKSSSSGKIGVFIVGGSDAGMYVDFVTGLKNGYYHYKYMWVVFASNTATTDRWITCNGLANTALVRAHDDNYSGSSIASVGKTAKQYFIENKQYISYVCGTKGCNFDSIAAKLANGGTEEDGESSASTIKDAIKEVASFWDGEVEIIVNQDVVKLRKIPNPETDHLSNEIIEGVNVQLSSINVSDYHPDTVNLLTVHWDGGEDIIFRDEYLISRFGEKSREMDAVKKIVKKDDETENTSTESASTSEDATSEETEEETTTSNTSYEEVPVETYEEALEFANTEWAKIRRNNGHEIELKVIGDYTYKPGWVKVILYSYPTDMFMYIKSSSHEISETGEFNTNVTLVDYPPSLGEWNQTENDEEETSEDEEVEE